MFANATGALLETFQRMLHFAPSHGAGGNHERAIGHRIGDVLALFGAGENVSRADRGTGLAKGRRIGIDHTQVVKAEVAHGARGCADVQRIARADQHYMETVEFSGRWQEGYFMPASWMGASLRS